MKEQLKYLIFRRVRTAKMSLTIAHSRKWSKNSHWKQRTPKEITLTDWR